MTEITVNFEFPVSFTRTFNNTHFFQDTNPPKEVLDVLEKAIMRNRVRTTFIPYRPDILDRAQRNVEFMSTTFECRVEMLDYSFQYLHERRVIVTSWILLFTGIDLSLDSLTEQIEDIIYDNFHQLYSDGDGGSLQIIKKVRVSNPELDPYPYNDEEYEDECPSEYEYEDPEHRRLRQLGIEDEDELNFRDFSLCVFKPQNIRIYA
jgi:hypothetical protein